MRKEPLSRESQERDRGLTRPNRRVRPSEVGAAFKPAEGEEEGEEGKN